MKTPITPAESAPPVLRWDCLLKPTDVADLFHAAHRCAGISGHDECQGGCWRMFDQNGKLIYEVANTRGAVPIDAPHEVKTLFAKAFEMFPEAFGRRGANYERVAANQSEHQVIHRLCA